MVNIKSTRELLLMKEAGRVVGLVFKTLKEKIRPGMTTLEIDEIVEKTMLDNECIPAEKGYYGYPASACVSVNDTLIHGIPSNKIILKEGDIVSVDIVANYNGYMADACRTFKVGRISERAERLVNVTKQAFFEALKVVKVGNHIGMSQVPSKNMWKVTDITFVENIPDTELEEICTKIQRFQIMEKKGSVLESSRVWLYVSNQWCSKVERILECFQMGGLLKAVMAN